MTLELTVQRGIEKGDGVVEGHKESFVYSIGRQETSLPFDPRGERGGRRAGGSLGT